MFQGAFAAPREAGGATDPPKKALDQGGKPTTRSRSVGHEKSDDGHSPELLSPFSVFALQGADIDGFASPVACALRFSQPLDALIPPQQSRLVSSRSHSWVSDLPEASPRWMKTSSGSVRTCEPVRAAQWSILSQVSASPGPAPPAIDMPSHALPSCDSNSLQGLIRREVRSSSGELVRPS